MVKAVNIATAWKLPDGSGYHAEDFVRGFVAEQERTAGTVAE
ncbi:MAG: hypothetical protein ABJB11_08190 [Ferruginibacter sp.]